MAVENENDDLIRNFLALRQAMGSIGIALPFLLALGYMAMQSDVTIRTSISAYYYTPLRDVMVGCLCAIGVFLWFYRGYDKTEHRIALTTALFIVAVAIFPTAPENPSSTQKMFSIIHSIAAGAFFVLISYLCLARFTRGKGVPTPEKKKRNRVYKGSGIIMLSCVAIMGVLKLLGIAGIDVESTKWYVALRPVFMLESAAIIAFGVAWLTKGEAILKDLHVQVPVAAATRELVNAGN